MLEALCHPDEELVIVAVICLVVALLHSAARWMNYAAMAETCLDPNHWAGLYSKDGPSHFLCQCFRVNTGRGYTPEGRQIWWTGFRRVVLCLAVLALGLVWLLAAKNLCA